MRTSMVTCSDDILLRSYLRHRNVTERQSLAKPGRREDTVVVVVVVVFCLFVFFVFFQGRFEQGLK